MKNSEFDVTKFFYGMKGKVYGKWYPLISADFEDRTITIDDEKESIIHCCDIQQLEDIDE